MINRQGTPIGITWAEARRSMEEGARWNAGLPKWDPPPAPTPRPRRVPASESASEKEGEVIR